MPIKPFLVISTELIREVPYGSAVSVWASVASVKFPDGTQMVICTPPDGNPGCFRFHPWFTLGSSVVVETRVELTRRFWFIFLRNWGNFSALGTSRLFSEP